MAMCDAHFKQKDALLDARQDQNDRSTVHHMNVHN